MREWVSVARGKSCTRLASKIDHCLISRRFASVVDNSLFFNFILLLDDRLTPLSRKEEKKKKRGTDLPIKFLSSYEFWSDER